MKNQALLIIPQLNRLLDKELKNRNIKEFHSLINKVIS